MTENLLGQMQSYARNGAKATIQAIGKNRFTAEVQKISLMPYDVQVNFSIETKGKEGVYEIVLSSNGSIPFTAFVNHEYHGNYPKDAELFIPQAGTYHFRFTGENGRNNYKLCFDICTTIGTYSVSNISVTKVEATETTPSPQPQPSISEKKEIIPETEEIQEASEKIQELESTIEFYDKKLSALVGKSVRIVPECKEYFTRNHELRPLAEDDILRSMIFTVKDYQFGMYVLSFPKKCDILVSFEMVTRF